MPSDTTGKTVVKQLSGDVDQAVKEAIFTLLTDEASPVDFNGGEELILTARRVREGFLVDIRFLVAQPGGQIVAHCASSFVKTPEKPRRLVEAYPAAPVLGDRFKNIEPK